VTLPSAALAIPIASASRKLATSSLPPPAPHIRRVLVAGADEQRRETHSALLRAEGYEVLGVACAEELFSAVGGQVPDLILLDVNLPDRCGYEVCGELRMLQTTQTTPIILFNAQEPDEHSVCRGLLSGADDYLEHPGRQMELRVRVRVQLRNLRDRELLRWARSQRRDFKRAALRDALTGIPNRRFADETLAELAEAGGKLAAMIVDIDHFKRVNDTWGHAVGDEVLTQVAAALAHQARRDDVVARFGGEEFLVLLVGASPELTPAIAERFRRAVANTDIANAGGPDRITVSIGVAAWVGESIAPATLLAEADAALYEAKDSGRDRVVVRMLAEEQES